MKEENEITEEVKQLLDSLEQHGANARRQKELGDLIDSLSSGTSLRGAELAERRGNPPSSTVDCFVADVPRNDAKRRKLYPLWWAIGAAAVCLLLWLLARPVLKETPNMDEKNLVEETGAKDTIITQEEPDFVKESVILEEPVPEPLLAEEAPVQPVKPKAKTPQPTEIKQEEVVEEPLLAENTPVEPEITETEYSTVNDQPSTQSTPQRRVIRSLNLVCYDCKTESSQFSVLPPIRSVSPSGFRSPFDPDPNMKNGSLAFELKLH